MNKEFLNWYNSNTGFILRSERAHSELINCPRTKVIDVWLQAAFEAGYHQAQHRQTPRELLVTQQERAALLDGGAGWLDSVETK